MITGCRDRNYQWEGSSSTLHKQFRRANLADCTQSKHQANDHRQQEGRVRSTHDKSKNSFQPRGEKQPTKRVVQCGQVKVAQGGSAG
jgi:hypothetical protein